MSVYSLPLGINPVEAQALQTSGSVDIDLIAYQHKDIIYGQVILNPETVDLGNLVGDRSENVELWNVAGDLTINSIIPNNAEGLQLVGQSTGLIPLGVTGIYTLNASPDGPSVIDATFEWNFAESQYNTSLSVVGSRTPKIDYDIDWNVTPKLYYSHYTNIIESYEGNEQRFGLTENPRLAFEYTYFLLDTDMRDLMNLIYSSQDATFQVPDFTKRAEILQNASAGDNIIYVDTSYNDIQADFSIQIGDKGNSQILKVTSVDKNTNVILLESNLTKDVFIGDSVYLMLPCTINSSLQTTHQIRNWVQTTIRYDVQDNTVDNIVNKEINLDVYEGLYVLYQKPNIDVTVDRTSERLIDVYDNSFGIRGRVTKDKAPATIINYTFDVIGEAEIYNVLAFFEGMKGRLNEFLITSGIKDFVVTDNILATDTTIDVENNGQLEFNNDIQKQYIRIESSKGVFYRKILNIASSGNVLKLFIDSNLGVNIDFDEVYDIQFLSNSRLNNDEVVVEKLTNDFATISVDVKILRNNA